MFKTLQLQAQDFINVEIEKREKERQAEATAKQVSNGSNPKSDWDQGYGYQFWRSRNGAYRGDGAFAGAAIASGAVSLALSKLMPSGAQALNNPAAREAARTAEEIHRGCAHIPFLRPMLITCFHKFELVTTSRF